MVGEELERRQQVGQVLGRLSGDGLDRRERTRLLGRLTALLGSSARSAGSGAALSGQWLADLVAEIGPHLPVRDLLTLRAHYGGLSGAALADALVRNAARTTAAIGAAAGALSAVELAAPPTLLAAPVQVAAGTLAVVAVELKLLAELHVTYGRAPVGSRGQVATAYLTAWVSGRGINPTGGGPGLASVLGSAARQQLRSRVVRRLGRNVTTLAPFLVGALAGAELNRRETRKLAESVLRDLQGHR